MGCITDPFLPSSDGCSPNEAVCELCDLMPQVNVTIVDVGRTAEGCAAYLSVGSATQGWCQTTTSGLGSSTSPGAQNWLLTDVPDEPGMVYISNEVRCGCLGVRVPMALTLLLLLLLLLPPLTWPSPLPTAASMRRHEQQWAAACATWAPAPPTAPTPRQAYMRSPTRTLF